MLTARRRDGSLELRVAVRVIKGNRPVERRDVQDLRRDLGNYGANLGLICSPGEPRGDAKSEALSGALVMLWCGEGLADKFFEAHVGVNVQTLELYEIDEAFFDRARVDAEDARARREERHLAKSNDRTTEAAAPSAPQAPVPTPVEFPAASVPTAVAAEGTDDDGDDEEGGEEGAPEAGAVAGAPGTEGEAGRRRRRRRRGRRGRGPKEGVPGTPADGSVVAAAAPSAPSTEIPSAQPTAPSPAQVEPEPPAPAPTVPALDPGPPES